MEEGDVKCTQYKKNTQKHISSSMYRNAILEIEASYVICHYNLDAVAFSCVQYTHYSVLGFF